MEASKAKGLKTLKSSTGGEGIGVKAKSEEAEPARIPVRLHTLPKDKHALCRRVAWLENFYEVLWACSVEGFEVPFTLCYQYNRPHAAYYTEDGQLKKVEARALETGPAQTTKASAATVNVLDKLTAEDKEEAGVMSLKTKTGAQTLYVFSRDYFLQGDKDLAVEFHTPKEMENFLFFRPKEQNGVLQKFIDPNASKVSSIRAYWTPHLCQIEGIQNNNFADDKKMPLQRKCCTFDGTSNDVTHCAINKMTEKKVLTCIEKIVEAVRRIITRGLDIQVMVLHFKASTKGKLWFLYCSSLRLIDESEIKNSAAGVVLPVGVTEGELKRRLYAVTTDRPNTARAQEAQLPPALGKGSKNRRGKECIVTGKPVVGNSAYLTTAQDLMVHFLWHGISSGYDNLGNEKESLKAFDEETRIGERRQRSAEDVQNNLRRLLTGNPKTPLKFVQDAAGFESMLKDDDFLNMCYRMWENSMITLFSHDIDNLNDEQFVVLRCQKEFLQRKMKVCEDAMLAISTTLSDILLGFDMPKNKAKLAQAAKSSKESKQIFSSAAPQSFRHRAPSNLSNPLRSRAQSTDFEETDAVQEASFQVQQFASIRPGQLDASFNLPADTGSKRNSNRSLHDQDDNARADMWAGADSPLPMTGTGRMSSKLSGTPTGGYSKTKNSPKSKVKRGGKRSTSAPPGALPEEQRPLRAYSLAEKGTMSEVSAMAWKVMRRHDQTTKDSFFGGYNGTQWIPPALEPDRFLRGEVSKPEMEFWFKMFARKNEVKMDSQISGMSIIFNQEQEYGMLFTDFEFFLGNAQLLHTHMNRAVVADVYQRIGLSTAPFPGMKPEDTFGKGSRFIGLSGFLKCMSKLLLKARITEKGKISSVSEAMMHDSSQRSLSMDHLDENTDPSLSIRSEKSKKLSVYFDNNVTVVDHVQLPNVFRYNEVDKSKMYLEVTGRNQKFQSYTKGAADLMATSRVARQMLKHPVRTAALRDEREIDVRALMGPLPEKHVRVVKKPEVVLVQQTVDLSGDGLPIPGSMYYYNGQRCASAASSVDFGDEVLNQA